MNTHPPPRRHSIGLGLLLLTACAENGGLESPALATNIAINEGNNQSAAPGAAVATAPSVKVTDADGNPVSGVAITFAVASGGGSLAEGDQATNASGIATVGSWTLGSTPGTNTLTATATGLTGSPVTFTASVGAISVTAVTPTSGRQAGGISVTITGTSFIDVTGVTIGGIELGSRTVVSPTEITGTTPAATTLGATDLVVTSSTYGSATCSGCFSYVSNPVLVAIVAGSQHTCGLTDAGAAYCWGFNDAGQLGTGSITQPSLIIPVLVAGGHTFSVLAAGMAHTCGITPAGAAYCWGDNVFSQRGDNSHTTHPSSVPVPVAGGHSFAGISAGGVHTCGVTTSGVAFCWGSGNLGAGTHEFSEVPIPVAGGHTFSDVSASGTTGYAGHSCGLTTNGTVYCWGGNDWGQLGNGLAGELEYSTVPVRVRGLSFFSVSAGLAHTCGLGTGGVAYCWGANSLGELGDGTTTQRSTPVAVSGGQGFSTLTPARSGLHNCGLTISGAAFCWGWNNYGQLGTGGEEDPDAQSSTPVAVSGGLSFSALALGSNHTCGVTTDGVYCWGRNDFGQLGNGSRISSTVPIRVQDVP